MPQVLPYNPRVARRIEIHPTHPQPRLINAVVEALRGGALIAYPTDSSYAFGCHIGDKRAMDRIRRIRKTDKAHNFTLVCSDLSEISVYARVDNWAYRLIKGLTPGPYTFILQDHPVVHAMLDCLGEPIMSSTLSLPGDNMPMTDSFEIEERIGHEVDVIIEAGPAGIAPTTVIDLTHGSPEILRQGLGDVSSLL